MKPMDDEENLEVWVFLFRFSQDNRSKGKAKCFVNFGSFFQHYSKLVYSQTSTFGPKNTDRC